MGAEPLAFDEGRFRDGIFALRTQRFGRVAELLVQRFTQAGAARTRFHDLFHVENGERLEVKVSCVLRKHAATINQGNVLAVIMSEAAIREVHFADRTAEGVRFDCNIQQVKPAQFDRLYYGTFFHDAVVFFVATSTAVPEMPGWSGHQHFGNEGEGQFHITQRNIEHHLAKHHARTLSYREFWDLLSG